MTIKYVISIFTLRTLLHTQRSSLGTIHDTTFGRNSRSRRATSPQSKRVELTTFSCSELKADLQKAMEKDITINELKNTIATLEETQGTLNNNIFLICHTLRKEASRTVSMQSTWAEVTPFFQMQFLCTIPTCTFTNPIRQASSYRFSGNLLSHCNCVYCPFDYLYLFKIGYPNQWNGKQLKKKCKRI